MRKKKKQERVWAYYQNAPTSRRRDHLGRILSSPPPPSPPSPHTFPMGFTRSDCTSSPHLQSENTGVARPFSLDFPSCLSANCHANCGLTILEQFARVVSRWTMRRCRQCPTNCALMKPDRVGAGYAFLEQDLRVHACIRVHTGVTKIWNQAGGNPELCDVIARVQDPTATVWKG